MGVRTEPGTNARPGAEVLAELAALIADGHLEVPIANVYPLTQVRQAYTDSNADTPTAKSCSDPNRHHATQRAQGSAQPQDDPRRDCPVGHPVGRDNPDDTSDIRHGRAFRTSAEVDSLSPSADQVPADLL
jgi:hypothetical protein